MPTPPTREAVTTIHREFPDHATILPWSIAESPCGTPPGGAILSGPSAPETFVGLPRSPIRNLGRTGIRCHERQI
jgi:hypothetical protein